MLLAIDIGNSSIKAGMFEKGNLTGAGVLTSLEELTAWLPSKDIKGAAVSSVVPDFTFRLSQILKESFNVLPFVITKDSRFNLKIDYDTPESLGIDRLCSAEGAFAEFKGTADSAGYDENVFITTIDFGTATTINIIRYPGVFIGGVIAPGIKTMIASLKAMTAQLPFVETSDYRGIIGKDTKSSIAGGIITSTTGLIEKTFKYIESEYKAEKIITYITGGNAEKILPYLNFSYSFEKSLVLKGIKAVYDINSEV